ncbi:MAG: hypothetical protein SFT90_07140, partial [Rickettsiales bacterium]|nr:hypothetical protein [Rickettsiales bacterium]
SAGASIIAEIIITDADLNSLASYNNKLTMAGFNDSQIIFSGTGGNITLNKLDNITGIGDYAISTPYDIVNNQLKMQVVLLPDGYQKISGLTSLNNGTSIEGIVKIKIADGPNNTIVEQDVRIVIDGKTNVVDNPPTIILDGFADGVNAKTINESNLNSNGDTLLGKINISDDIGFSVDMNTNIPFITADLQFDNNGTNINLIQGIHYNISQLMGSGNNRYYEVFLTQDGKNFLAPLLDTGESVKIKATITALDSAPNGGNAVSEDFEFTIEGVNSPSNSAPVISINPSTNFDENNINANTILHTWTITDSDANDDISITLGSLSGTGFNFPQGKTLSDYFVLDTVHTSPTSKNVLLKVNNNANLNEIKQLLDLGDTGTINFNITATDNSGASTTRNAEVKIDGKGMDLEIRDIVSDFTSNPLDDADLSINTSIVEFSVRDDQAIINPVVTLKLQGSANNIPTNLYSVVFVQNNDNLPDYYEKQYKVVFNQAGVDFIKNNVAPSQLKNLEIIITTANGNPNPSLLEIDVKTLSIGITDSSTPPAPTGWFTEDPSFNNGESITEITLTDHMNASGNFDDNIQLAQFIVDCPHSISRPSVNVNQFASSNLWYDSTDLRDGIGGSLFAINTSNGGLKGGVDFLYQIDATLPDGKALVKIILTKTGMLNLKNQMAADNNDTIVNDRAEFGITIKAKIQSDGNPNTIDFDDKVFKFKIFENDSAKAGNLSVNYNGFAELNDADGVSVANQNLSGNSLDITFAEDVTDNGVLNVLKDGNITQTILSVKPNNGDSIASANIDSVIAMKDSNGNTLFSLSKGAHLQFTNDGNLVLTKAGADFIASKLSGTNIATGQIALSLETSSGITINETYNFKVSNINMQVKEGVITGTQLTQMQEDILFDYLGDSFEIHTSNGDIVNIQTDDHLTITYDASQDAFSVWQESN